MGTSSLSQPQPGWENGAFLRAHHHCCTNAPVWNLLQPGCSSPAPFFCLWKFSSPASVPKVKLSNDRKSFFSIQLVLLSQRGAFLGWFQQLHVQTALSKLTPTHTLFLNVSLKDDLQV